MRIGHSTIPRMRVPALLKGQMILLDLSSLRGQWGIICCLPPFEFGEAVFLNQYHRAVQKEGAMLLGMLPFADPFLDPRLPKAKVLRIPLLADPLERLRRLLGLDGRTFNNRCQSFVVDPQGVIRYHHIHQLHWRGLAFLMEILKQCQEHHSLSTKLSRHLHLATSPFASRQLQSIKTIPRLIRTPSQADQGERYYVPEPTT